VDGAEDCLAAVGKAAEELADGPGRLAVQAGGGLICGDCVRWGLGEVRGVGGLPRKSSSSGRATISTAMVNLLRCSTFSPSPGTPTMASAYAVISSSSSTWSTYSSFSLSERRLDWRSRALNSSASRTVAVGMWMSSCWT